MKKFVLCLFVFNVSFIFSQTKEDFLEITDKVEQYKYALSLRNKVNKTEIDKANAVNYLLKSAKQGYANAQYLLGYCYMDGEGVPHNDEIACAWFKAAAEQGNVNAQYNVGVFYALGKGVSKSYETAFYWYKKAAEQGDRNGQRGLARCFYYGLGIDQNYTEAFRWFSKASEQEDRVSLFYLGECYKNGYGVSQDASAAFSLYEKAADAGHAGAQYALATMYLKGEACEIDSIYAGELLLTSACGGESGIGVFNVVFALDQLNKEKDQYPKAEKKIVELSEEGSPFQYWFLTIRGCLSEVKHDYASAEKYYKQAISQGGVLAIQELGIMYFYLNLHVTGELSKGPLLEIESMGWGDSTEVSYVISRNWPNNDNHIYWMEKAVEIGEGGTLSYSYMGYSIYDFLMYSYVNGLGVEPDINRAIDIAKMCIKDSAYSYFATETLCLALEDSSLFRKAFYTFLDVSSDPSVKFDVQYNYILKNTNILEKAFVICDKLADTPNMPDGLYGIIASILGSCYYNGIGVSHNYNKAFNFLYKAVNIDENDYPSIELLAACYRYGRGTQTDRIKEKASLDKLEKATKYVAGMKEKIKKLKRTD